MTETTNAVILAGIATAGSVAVALINMIGSVMMLYLRAKYQYTEQANGVELKHGIRHVPAAAKQYPTGQNPEKH